MDTEKICQFIEEIGISVKESSIDDDKCFVPGLQIAQGKILKDTEKLKYPGDLLHEAAHIAVVPEEERSTLNGEDIEKRPSKDGEEIAALLWSYLAAKHIGVTPQVVFHQGGYKDDSEWLIENFASKNYMGAPLLEWMGLVTRNPETNDLEIVRWLRE